MTYPIRLAVLLALPLLAFSGTVYHTCTHFQNGCDYAWYATDYVVDHATITCYDEYGWTTTTLPATGGTYGGCPGDESVFDSEDGQGLYPLYARSNG